MPENPGHSDTHDRLARVEAILTGPDGDNGLRGDLYELRQEVREISQRLSKIDVRMASYVGIAVGAWALAEKFLLK